MPWATPDAADLRTQLVRVAEADELWESGTEFIYSVLLSARADRGRRDRAAPAGRRRRHGDRLLDRRRLRGPWLRDRGGAALTAAALALPGVTRVEIHCDEANNASAAIPRKLGYQLDRIDRHDPEAPGEQGRRMVWVRRAGG